MWSTLNTSLALQHAIKARARVIERIGTNPKAVRELVCAIHFSQVSTTFRLNFAIIIFIYSIVIIFFWCKIQTGLMKKEASPTNNLFELSCGLLRVREPAAAQIGHQIQNNVYGQTGQK